MLPKQPPSFPYSMPSHQITGCPLFLNPAVWHDPSTNGRGPTRQGLLANSVRSDSKNDWRGPLVSWHLAEEPGLMSRGLGRPPNEVLKEQSLSTKKAMIPVLFLPWTPRNVGFYRIEFCFLSQPLPHLTPSSSPPVPRVPRVPDLACSMRPLREGGLFLFSNSSSCRS